MNGKIMKEFIRPALLSFIILSIICGGLYTFAITGIAQVLFPYQANGSIIKTEDGSVVGSELLAQNFTEPQYLIGRPTTETGGPTNLSALSLEQEELVKSRVTWWQDLDPQNTQEIPMDLVTVSGSGVDPEISSDGANYQVERIAKERKMPVERVQKIIDDNTKKPTMGFLGEPVVNVLTVNLALDAFK